MPGGSGGAAKSGSSAATRLAYVHSHTQRAGVQAHAAGGGAGKEDAPEAVQTKYQAALASARKPTARDRLAGAPKRSATENRIRSRERSAQKLEMAKNDIPAEHRFLAGHVKGSARMSRAEAVAHFVHNNKAEVMSMRQAKADRDVAKMIKAHEKGPGVKSTYKPNFADSAWNF